MRYQAFFSQALCLLLGAAAIEITNTEFNVERGVDFEVTWEDAGGDRVDIDLYTYPIWSFVEALSRGKTNYVKEYSRTVLVSEDIEPRMYCFFVTDWPSGQRARSEGFFFNGTGTATTTSPSPEDTPAPTASDTLSPPSDTGTPPPENEDGGGPRYSGSGRTTYSPMTIGLAAGGGLILLALAFWCFWCSRRDRKRRRAKTQAEAQSEIAAHTARGRDSATKSGASTETDAATGPGESNTPSNAVDGRVVQAPETVPRETRQRDLFYDVTVLREFYTPEVQRATR